MTGEVSPKIVVMMVVIMKIMNLFTQSDFQERKISINVPEQRSPIKMGKIMEISLISSQVRIKFLLRKQNCWDLGRVNQSSDP